MTLILYVDGCLVLQGTYARYSTPVKPGQHGPGFPHGSRGILQHAPDRGAAGGCKDLQKEHSVQQSGPSRLARAILVEIMVCGARPIAASSMNR